MAHGSFTLAQIGLISLMAAGLVAAPGQLLWAEPSASVDWIVEGQNRNAWMGNSVATAGDVNGDGFDDVIVGASHHTNGQEQEGRAYAYLGSPSGLSTSPAWTVEGDESYAAFGDSVGTAGDVNGDGYDDVIVGAPDYLGDGRVFVYLGSATGLSDVPAWVGEGEEQSTHFGESAAGAGDVNGDGYDDVIVGESSQSNPEAGEGRAYVYLGSLTGLSTTAAWTAESDSAYANFGLAVGTAGDVNGDGFDDVIVGAPFYQDGPDFRGQGQAYLYPGSPLGPSTLPDWAVKADQRDANYGWSVGTAEDVNGDGFDDVIVGAPMYDASASNEGRAFVYHGSAGGLSTTPAWTVESDVRDARLGFSAATAGDLNGDGFGDVIVGGPGALTGSDRGRIHLYRGSAFGLRHRPRVLLGDQASSWFGYSVATAGDVNGDGLPEVLGGAPLYDNIPTDEGRAFAVYGRAVRG